MSSGWMVGNDKRGFRQNLGWEGWEGWEGFVGNTESQYRIMGLIMGSQNMFCLPFVNFSTTGDIIF